ncbi:MAG: protocatechuate 3,4-dioxygenase subunit alpha [Janthinobacterium lividum]
MTLKQTPSQTVGPFFAYGLTPTQYSYELRSIFSPTIAQPQVPGEHILVTGRVLDGNDAPIFDALLEVLQPDAQGQYVTHRKQAIDSGFAGFGRVGTGTDAQHRYTIETIKPGVANAGDAPHLDVIVSMRGLLLHAFTRIYFEDEAANANDPVLNAVPAARRPTMIATREPIEGRKVYRFDIRMQGPQETVFFDL